MTNLSSPLAILVLAVRFDNDKFNSVEPSEISADKVVVAVCEFLVKIFL